MSITLIRRPREDTRSKTGLGRYADSIEDVLMATGTEYSVVEADITLENGAVSCLKKGFLVPLRNARRLCRDRESVVHATDELCGVFFPFIRGRRVLTIHHVITDSEGRGRLYRALWTLITRISVRYADDIIAVSPNTAEDVRKAFNPRAPIHTIFNRPSSQYRRDDSIERGMVIGVVAELISRKNVEESVEAFGILSSFEGMEGLRMRICGRGLEKDNLLRIINDAGLGDKVEFIDSLTEEELFRFYNSMALLFNTSLHEGVGMVSLEANLCGTPTLCLERADIPAEVTAASIKCADAGDMARRAHDLLTNPELYSDASTRSIDAACRFGEGFSEKIVSLYGLN